MTNEMSTRTHSSGAITATGATQNMRNANLDAHTFATSMALWRLGTFKFSKDTDQQFRRQKIPRIPNICLSFDTFLKALDVLENSEHSDK
jgi:hypothetical protein